MIFQIDEKDFLENIKALTSKITPKTINIVPVIIPIDEIKVDGRQTKIIPTTASIIPRIKLTI